MTIARRMAFGFRSMGNLIAAIMLRCPNLPAAPPSLEGVSYQKSGDASHFYIFGC